MNISTNKFSFPINGKIIREYEKTTWADKSLRDEEYESVQTERLVSETFEAETWLNITANIYSTEDYRIVGLQIINKEESPVPTGHLMAKEHFVSADSIARGFRRLLNTNRRPFEGEVPPAEKIFIPINGAWEIVKKLS